MNGALVSAPNIAGVSVSTISRIGTRMSARLPVTWTLREPRIGEVTVVDRVCAWRSSSEGWAFIGGAPVSMQAGEPCFANSAHGCAEGRERTRVETGGAGCTHHIGRRSSLHRCEPDQVPRVSLSRCGPSPAAPPLPEDIEACSGRAGEHGAVEGTRAVKKLQTRINADTAFQTACIRVKKLLGIP